MHITANGTAFHCRPGGFRVAGARTGKHRRGGRRPLIDIQSV
jgi:hypothetical protein